jgi:hypothetical protein
MACRTPRERPMRGILVLAGALLAAVPPAFCDEHVLVGGLLDAEIWKTDGGSRLLSRNADETAPGGRLHLWAAGEFMPRLQGFVQGEAAGGKANSEYGTETQLEQAFVRYTFQQPVHLVVEAGQLVSPVGNFSRRYLSNVNPLIGSPDGYSLGYPLGAQATGRTGRFDYRLAIVDRPIVNEKYVPETGRALRPALAAGVTPFVGTRLGAYATRGPYLGPSVDPMLSSGEDWKDFDQAIYGLDLQVTHGYFELNGDYARSSYEAPGGGGNVHGLTYFIEPKYTWSPRFFTALRFERNDYAYVAPLGPGVWLATTADFYDVEGGAGCRLGPGTIVKVSYRRDHWMVDDALKSFFPDGYALSAQLSYSFNVNSLLERPK